MDVDLDLDVSAFVWKCDKIDVRAYKQQNLVNENENENWI